MIQLIETLINILFNVYYILILIRAFLPYIPHNRLHPVLKPVYDVTEPLLSVLRNGLPPVKIGIDASPFIALILIWCLQQLIFTVIHAFAPARVAALAGADLIRTLI